MIDSCTIQEWKTMRIKTPKMTTIFIKGNKNMLQSLRLYLKYNLISLLLLSSLRRIHKISSVCKYCCCNVAVTMVHMHAEFVGPFGRYGCDLQTIEPRLRIVLCVYNVQENQEARHM
jgi:hypothetical protein